MQNLNIQEPHWFAVGLLWLEDRDSNPGNLVQSQVVLPLDDPRMHRLAFILKDGASIADFYELAKDRPVGKFFCSEKQKNR